MNETEGKRDEPPAARIGAEIDRYLAGDREAIAHRPIDLSLVASAFQRRALTRLRDEYAASGRRALFDHLKGFLTGDSDDVPYSDAARALDMTEGAVKVYSEKMSGARSDLEAIAAGLRSLRAPNPRKIEKETVSKN